MKCFLYTILIIFLYVPLSIQSQSLNYNYIKTTQFNDINQGKPVVNVKYYDDLGRIIQNVDNKQSANGNDLIIHYEYDNFGRTTKNYLPYVDTNNSLDFRENSKNANLNYYTVNFNDSISYSEKIYENSPLNRVTTEGFPGQDWNVNTGHSSKFKYDVNSIDDKVIKVVTTLDSFLVPTFSIDGYYNENSLYKNTFIDENGNSSIEFKNVLNQVLLRRNILLNRNIDTYYVYDDFGNLSLVIPPNFGLNVNTNFTRDNILTLCYQYQYNNKNLLVKKNVPGQQVHDFYYDSKDRLFASFIFYQPFGEMIARSYIYNYYDDFNRLKITGTKLGSTFNPLTTVSQLKILTENFYDNYNFFNIEQLPSLILGQSVNYNVKSFDTGNKTAVLDERFNDNIKYDVNVVLYDFKYRPIANYVYYSDGGYNKIEYLLDWNGKTKEIHTNQKLNSNSTNIKIVETFIYNEQDYLIKHTHQINDGIIENLSLNQYNDLGSIVKKNVGGNGNHLQEIDFKYNIRGWLKDINDINTPEEKLFNYRIHYNDYSVNELATFAQPVFNGNISAIEWISSQDNMKKQYVYTYDNLNRLLKANYKNNINPLEIFDESLTYDDVGNIRSLERKGLIDPIGNFSETIDNLTYTYSSSFKNRLTKVVDATNNAEGFNSIGNVNQYTYDAEGNLVSDLNKNIENIIYNHLSLPIKIKFADGQQIEFIYKADGTKIQKRVYSDLNLTTTTYRNGFQYINDELSFFPHAEGYVTKTPTGNFEYIYNYVDHLGNVRLSYKKDFTAVHTGELTIVDASNYYPFGLKHKGVGTPNQDPNYKYKYNGKELQEELGLNMYDYGARNYDPALGRWMNIDPLAENSRRWTPYNYVYNNPLFYVDPDGMQAYPPSEEDLNNIGIAVEDVQNGYTWTDNDGSWSFNSESKTWEGINGTETDILAETIKLPEMNIEKPLIKKVSEFFSDIAAPFFETPQDILFPMINQFNVYLNEGLHEGGAYNRDNVLFPNTFELKNWKPVRGRSNTSTGNPTREEGQEIINNTISFVPLGLETGLGKNVIQKFVINKAATSAFKKSAQKVTEKIK